MIPASHSITVGLDRFLVTASQLRHKELLQHLIGDEHCLTLLVQLFLFDGRLFLTFFYGNAAHAGQFPYRFGECDMVVLHHELDGITALGASTKAVPGVPCLVHDEGRRAFLMKGAAALVVAAFLP